MLGTIWAPSAGLPVKHFQGSPREQARGRIVAPHLMLATVRASRPLAPRPPTSSREPYLLEPYKPGRSEALQAVERVSSAPRGSLFSRERGIVYRLGCGRWRCVPCAHRKAAAISNRFGRILWQRQPALVTLTAATADDAAYAKGDAKVRAPRSLVQALGGSALWAFSVGLGARSSRA